jgi:uncharacterized protein (UPF0147 family)
LNLLNNVLHRIIYVLQNIIHDHKARKNLPKIIQRLTAKINAPISNPSLESSRSLVRLWKEAPNLKENVQNPNLAIRQRICQNWFSIKALIILIPPNCFKYRNHDIEFELEGDFHSPNEEGMRPIPGLEEGLAHMPRKTNFDELDPYYGIIPDWEGEIPEFDRKLEQEIVDEFLREMGQLCQTNASNGTVHYWGNSGHNR